MKKTVLGFLKRERDELASELKELQRGERKIIHLNASAHDVTAEAIAAAEARLLRFEETIAAIESGVF